MDMEELSLLPSLPNSYVYDFFHSFELFRKNNPSQLNAKILLGLDGLQNLQTIY